MFPPMEPASSRPASSCTAMFPPIVFATTAPFARVMRMSPPIVYKDAPNGASSTTMSPPILAIEIFDPASALIPHRRKRQSVMDHRHFMMGSTLDGRVWLTERDGRRDAAHPAGGTPALHP